MMSFLRCAHRSLCLTKRLAHSGYVVVLPEIPDVKPQENCLLNFESNPSFDGFTYEKCYESFSMLALEHDTQIWNFEDRLEESGSMKFEDFLNELDKMESVLFKNMNLVQIIAVLQPLIITEDVFRRISEKGRHALCTKDENVGIQKEMKDYQKHSTGMNTFQKYIINKLLYKGFIIGSGRDIGDSMVLNLRSQSINQHTHLYVQNLEYEGKFYQDRIYDPVEVKEFPHNLLARMSLDGAESILTGPWTISLNNDIYEGILKYAPSRKIRSAIWKAYVNRASTGFEERKYSEEKAHNFKNLQSLRKARTVYTEYLDPKCSSYADFLIKANMAEKSDKVLSLIHNLHPKAKALQSQEMDSLKEFVESKGFKEDLEEYDVPYWRRHQKLQLFNYNELEPSLYFPFNHVFEQLLNLTSRIFGIEFEESDSSAWDKSVKVFNIYDESGLLSNFYVDPFERPRKGTNLYDGAWVVPYKSRCAATGEKPSVAFIYNFQIPDEHGVSLLSVKEVFTLFRKFGQGLQHLLSTVPVSLSGGMNNIEFDLQNFSSHFLAYWLHDCSLLSELCCHSEDKSQLSLDKIKAIIDGQSHMMGYDLCEELFLSHVDIRLYNSTRFSQDIVKILYPMYRPFKLHKLYALPCWHTGITVEDTAGQYYSNIWARGLAADVFLAFQNAGKDELKNLGLKLRKNLLSQIGGAPPTELFRDFLGRDPSHGSILTIQENQYDISRSSENV